MNMHEKHVIAPDADEVQRCVQIIHDAAARAFEGVNDPGCLQLMRIEPDSKPQFHQFDIGDMEGMTAQALADASAGFNVYVEGRTLKRLSGKDRSSRKRGSLEDTRGVFAFVIDDDADKDKGATGELPQASLIVETSPPANRHLWLFLDRAAPVGRAKEVGEALKANVGADDDTGVVTQPYRVAGTPNFPGKVKRERGRVTTPTRIIEASGIAYSVEDLARMFPAKAKGEKQKAKTNNKRASGKGVKKIIDMLRDPEFGGPGGNRSDYFQTCASTAILAGLTKEEFETLCNEHPNGCAARYIEEGRLQQEIERSWPKAEERLNDGFIRNDKGIVANSQDNVRLAIERLGARLSLDQFKHEIRIEGLDGFGPIYNDAAETELWLKIDREFRFRPTMEFFHSLTSNLAHHNYFHPVRDYLASLEWDGKPRIDTWLIDHAGAEDTPYTRAVSRLLLIAAVRRVRKPGCKFDEMVVFESPQGRNKSTALATLAIRPEWFTDSVSLTLKGKDAIEALEGFWMIEVAELKGIRKGATDHVKSFVSRAADKGRRAYGRRSDDVPRQCVFVGTTNDRQYLRDPTGNRRFWPIKVEAFNIDALKEARDQLWAEASYYEAKGESIRLDQSLWSAAAEQQETREVDDPWTNVLRNALTDANDKPINGGITSEDVWTILNIQPGSRTQEFNLRMGDAMRRIGFERAAANDKLYFKHLGKTANGYWRENKTNEIVAHRQLQDGQSVLTVHSDDSPF